MPSTLTFGQPRAPTHANSGNPRWVSPRLSKRPFAPLRHCQTGDPTVCALVSVFCRCWEVPESVGAGADRLLCWLRWPCGAVLALSPCSDRTVVAPSKAVCMCGQDH